MAKSAKPPKKAARTPGAIRPLLLAAGVGLYWFVEYQDAGGEMDGPMSVYLMVTGVRLLADIVGAWVALSAVQLVFVLARLGLTYVRSLWPQEG